MTEHKCPVCGKVFYVEPDFWAYKTKTTVNRYIGSATIFYCSWPCLRAKRAKKKYRKSRHKIRCVETGDTWSGAAEAADVLLVSTERVYNCCRDGGGMHTSWADGKGHSIIHLEYAT